MHLRVPKSPQLPHPPIPFPILSLSILNKGASYLLLQEKERVTQKIVAVLGHINMKSVASCVLNNDPQF